MARRVPIGDVRTAFDEKKKKTRIDCSSVKVIMVHTNSRFPYQLEKVRRRLGGVTLTGVLGLNLVSYPDPPD